MSEHRSEASRLVSRSAFGLDSLAGPSAAPEIQPTCRSQPPSEMVAQ
jgi:hypothetical protein